MMAKNVNKKKVRIAHNKYALDDSLAISPKSGCRDLIAKIMNDMDSNLISNNLTALADSTVSQKSITQKEYIQGTSENQASSTNIFKAKRRLGLDKKFPLMEKSRQNLKHLKHNRKIPKPRAHLSSLPQPPECIDNKKSETRKKNSSNLRKTAPSPRGSVTNNVTSNIRENFKKSESSRKVGNNSRKVGHNESVTNKASNMHDYIKKSEANTKVRNTSRKVSPYESVTTYQISPWLNSSKVNSLERNKNRKEIEKIETEVAQTYSKKDKTIVTKKCSKKEETSVTKKSSKKDDCSSVSDVDDIRNECSDSEASDSDFEKFVQTQRKESNSKKRRKKQPATAKKKTKQKSSIQKQKEVKKGAKVKSSLQYDSDSIVRTRKRCKVNNKSIKLESSDEEMENNYSPRSEDEFAGGDEFYDNDVYTRDSSDDETVLNVSNTVSAEPKSNEQPVTSEENSLEMKDNLEVNGLSGNNPNVNVYSRDSSSGDDTVLNAPDNESVESESKNKQVLSEVKSLRVTNHPNAVFNSTSYAKDLAQESAESPMLIDLSLSDNECEHTNSIPQESTEKSEVKKAVIHNLPNTSNSQSDDESDLEIVDVVLPSDMRELGKVTDNKHNLDGSINELNIKIEKETVLENKTQNPQNRQKSETVIKHEAAFSTNICQRPAEADLNATPVINNDNTMINHIKIKKETDGDIIVLNDQTASTTFPDPSQISPVASTSINTNVKHEITARKTENPIENVTNAGETVPSKEKLLHEVACSNIRTLIPNDKPTKFSSLSVEDVNNMDVKTLLQMFKNEFQTYQEIIETQESIGYSFKLLENRQAEKLLSLKNAIKKYMGDLTLNSSNVDFPLEKTESSSSKLLASNPGMSSMCSNTVCDSDVRHSHLQASSDFSQANLVPLSSVRDIKPNVSELQGTSGCDQKLKESSVMSFGEKCIVCSKDALAACQQCAKVFFCSNKCGETYWNSGHRQLCSK